MPDDVAEMISKPKKENIFSISEIIFSLEKITIPSSVTKIGESVFEGCYSLKQIIIPIMIFVFAMKIKMLVMHAKLILK